MKKFEIIQANKLLAKKIMFKKNILPKMVRVITGISDEY
jgi:hypothetical protein